MARRGYFLEGFGGAQFALPGAVERLRARSAERERRPTGAGRRRSRPALWRRAALAQERNAARRPSRAAGAYVVLAGGRPGSLSRAGRPGPADPRRRRRARPRAGPGGAGRAGPLAAAIKRLALEKVDGQTAISSPLAPALTALGFQESPRRLTLSAWPALPRRSARPAWPSSARRSVLPRGLVEVAPCGLASCSRSRSPPSRDTEFNSGPAPRPPAGQVAPSTPNRPGFRISNASAAPTMSTPIPTTTSDPTGWGRTLRGHWSDATGQDAAPNRGSGP